MPIQFEENFTLFRWSAFSKRDIILAYHKLLWAVRRKIHVTEPLQHISKLSDLSTLGFPRSGDGEMAILPCNGIYGFREYLSPLLFAQYLPVTNCWHGVNLAGQVMFTDILLNVFQILPILKDGQRK